MNKLMRQALALFLVMACMATLALNAGAQFNGKELALNYSGAFPSVLTISGQAITIEGLSQDDDYRYIMLDFLDSRGNEVFNTTTARSRDGTATFRVSGVPAGRYSVLLYHADREYTTYHAFLWDIEIAPR